MSTKIDWCNEVWNPTTGCTKGCSYCYARPFAKRMRNHPNEKISIAYQRGFEPTCHADRLDIPLKWKRPRRIFVDSMGDLFDPGIPFEFIDKVIASISLHERHTFMILTKQPQRMKEYFDNLYRQPHLGAKPIDNLLLGVSVTNQNEADHLIPILLDTPASVRFISAEPLLSEIDIWGYHQNQCQAIPFKVLRPRIDWVICGGETGKNAEPLYPGSVLKLRDQCTFSGIPFFFKGWGEWFPIAPVYEERECPDEPGVIDGDWPQSEVDRYEEAGCEVIALEPGGHIPYWCKGSRYQVEHQPRSDAWYMVRLGKKRMKATIQGREWREFPV